jgi:hypothetical protein
VSDEDGERRDQVESLLLNYKKYLAEYTSEQAREWMQSSPEQETKIRVDWAAKLSRTYFSYKHQHKV